MDVDVVAGIAPADIVMIFLAWRPHRGGTVLTSPALGIRGTLVVVKAPSKTVPEATHLVVALVAVGVDVTLLITAAPTGTGTSFPVAKSAIHFVFAQYSVAAKEH